MAATVVLLLNASFEPLGKVSWEKAVKMLFREVAVTEEGVTGPNGEPKMIGPHVWPKVVRLIRYIAPNWMYRPAGFSKQSVLARDSHKCAYCRGRASTVDHIQPESRGGSSSFKNLVAACSPCNGKKADRTPQEAGMRLLWQPWHPTRAQLAGL